MSVNPVDTVQDARGLVGRAESQRQHRPDGPPRATQIAATGRVKPAVVGNAGGHERMRELQEDGAPPAEEHDRLAIHAAGHGRGRGTAHPLIVAYVQRLNLSPSPAEGWFRGRERASRCS